MLKKFIAIKNVGRFLNSAAPGNPQLARQTLILGANGFGKTTIGAVFRSLQTGDPSYILAPANTRCEALRRQLSFCLMPDRFASMAPIGMQQSRI